MNISIIVGSHRQNSQSSKVGNFILDQLKKLHLYDENYLIDLAQIQIPFWDESFWAGDEKWEESWQPIGNLLEKSDAYIFITPEWGGMVPAKLKNLLLFPNSRVTGHKPALIVSVSSGLGGSYPINELRTSGYKNTKICFIPEHIIVRKVEEVLNQELNEGSEFDSYIRDRISYAIQLLKVYSVGFKEIRNTEFNFDEYQFGM